MNWIEDDIENLVKINASTIGRKFIYDTIEYFDTSTVTEGIFDLPQIIEMKDAPSRAKRLVKDDDIIISTVRPNLKHFGIIKGFKPNSVVSTGFAVITAIKIDSKFLYYFLSSNFITDYLALIAENQTSTYPSFNPALIKKIKVRFPVFFKYQQQISNILGTYDNLLKVNNLRIKLLEDSAKEIYKEWFVRMRFPGYKNTKFVKGFPENWEIKKFGQVIELSYGKALKDGDREGGEHPVYGSSGIVGYHNTFIAKAPGIVVGRKGNVGSVFWVTKDFYPIDTAFFVKSKISLYYLYYNLLNQNFIEGDAAVPGLNRNQAYSNLIIIPDESLLKKFDEIIRPIFVLIDNLTDQNTQLRQIRDRLLPRLISGKLQVKQAIEMPDASIAHHDIITTQIKTTAKTKKLKPYFQRRVLAAYIIDHLKNEITFGHVKLMKLMYLCEHLASIEMASNYHRDAAGPYDNKMMRSIDKQLRDAEWFNCMKTDGKNIYHQMPKSNEYKAWFEKYYSDKRDGIDSLLHIFGKVKTEKAEMVATLYEAHRDLKSKYQIVSDNTIINEVLNNWHDSKKRIEEQRWAACLQWMKEKGWVT